MNTQNELQVRCDILEGELQTEKQMYTSMDSEMKKLRINNVVSNSDYIDIELCYVLLKGPLV